MHVHQPCQRTWARTALSLAAPDTDKTIALAACMRSSCALCPHLRFSSCFPRAAPDTDKMIELQLFLDMQEFGRQAKQARHPPLAVAALLPPCRPAAALPPCCGTAGAATGTGLRCFCCLGSKQPFCPLQLPQLAARRVVLPPVSAGGRGCRRPGELPAAVAAGGAGGAVSRHQLLSRLYGCPLAVGSAAEPACRHPAAVQRARRSPCCGLHDTSPTACKRKSRPRQHDAPPGAREHWLK